MEYYYDFHNGRLTGRYVDLDGKPVERTPDEYPYSYDPYVVFKSEKYRPTDCWVYDDRMKQWDRDKYNVAAKAVWPQNASAQCFNGKSPGDINRFLNLYFGREVLLTAILEGCNHGNGYPYWVFVYREVN